jgi:putative DNA primase/helicase
MTSEARKLDWNDLHVAHGLDAVRAQLAQALTLPRTPSEVQPPEAAAATEGAGEDEEAKARRAAAIAAKVFQRFALVEGKTTVFDMHKQTVLKKTAFEALVTKPVATAWFGRMDKKLIAEDQAQRLVDQAKLAGKATRDGGTELSPVERYVYIDGTKDAWDVAKRRRVPEGAVKMALSDAYGLWLNSPQRRTVDMDHIVFDPTMTKDPEVYINTFEGLPLTPEDAPEKCRTLRGMIGFLCNGDPDATHWLTCWLAYPLQHLGAKMDTAVLMHSTMEGSGKSLLSADIMGEIYGAYAATVGQAQLESSWTVWQSNKLYAVFEEVVSRDQRYNQVGKIKHMITGKTVRMESKFVNGWEEANHMNAVFLSNEIMPWPISENDRRMLVIWPEETLPEERQKAVEYELANGGLEALYGYLLSYDLGDFNRRTRPPHTEARDRLVALSRASWENFFVAWKYGTLGVPFGVARTEDVHDLFLVWCSRNREHTLSATKLSLFLSTKVPKTTGQIGWYGDDGVRRRSMLFVPEEDSVNPSDGKAIGAKIRAFRRAAHWAGWEPEKWEKCQGFTVPMAAERPAEVA